MADADVVLSGWGRDSWNSGAWGNPAIAIPSMQGQVGTAVVREDISV